MRYREIIARVEAVCLSMEGVRVAKEPRDEAFLGPHGFVGDRHATEFRKNPYNGKPIRNKRQWTAISTLEVDAMCVELGVRPFEPGALGENLRLSGDEPLSQLVEGTTLEFPSGARLQVSGPNTPCMHAARELAIAYAANVERDFIKAAHGRRGVLGVVLQTGVICPGDDVRILVPLPEGIQAALI